MTTLFSCTALSSHLIKKTYLLPGPSQHCSLSTLLHSCSFSLHSCLSTSLHSGTTYSNREHSFSSTSSHLSTVWSVCLVCLSGLSVWFVCLVCLSEWSVSGPSVCLVRPSVWSICLSGPSVCLSVLPFSASISLALQDLLCLLPAPKYLQLHGEHGVSRHLGMVSENSQAGLWATP